jgi:hypothetical protein
MNKEDTGPTQVDQVSKREYWRSQIQAWEKSGLKQEAYCKRAGINYSTFVYWRGIFLSESSQPKYKKRFLPIKLEKTASSELPRAIQIKLLSGHSVYLPITIGIQDIAVLLHQLGMAHA